MSLPQQLGLSQMQNTWATALDPVISNPLNSVNVLKNVQLVSGTNVVNHLLGRRMQGWFIVDIDAAVIPYRSSPFNSLTLTLTCSAPCTVNLGVF